MFAGFFAGFKYRHAQNIVLVSLKQSGGIPKEKISKMVDIGYNLENVSYGRNLITSGAAMNKYAAVAVVFARLTSAAKRSNSKNVTADNWAYATGRAMEFAGARKIDAVKVADELIASEDEAAKRTTL